MAPGSIPQARACKLQHQAYQGNRRNPQRFPIHPRAWPPGQLHWPVHNVDGRGGKQPQRHALSVGQGHHQGVFSLPCRSGQPVQHHFRMASFFGRRQAVGPEPCRCTVVAIRPRACHHLDWEVRDWEESPVIHHGQLDVCFLEDSRG